MGNDELKIATFNNLGLSTFVYNGTRFLSQHVSILGVDYVWLKTPDGGDLYLTRYGLPLWRSLLPENWYAREWLETQGERLKGTSTIYKLPTRPVDGRVYTLVVKWSRVGEEVPLDTLTVTKFVNAEFNSPFEEFALLMELRRGDFGPPGIRVRTQYPLAIYVPGQRLQLWQTGRCEEKIRAKIAKHPGVEIDILRQYVLLFGWIKGIDAAKAAELMGLKDEERVNFFGWLTGVASHELALKGYQMIDMKPEHIILRLRDGKPVRDRNGQVIYAVVDYELLQRTSAHEDAVRAAHRKVYLIHMAKRFESPIAQTPPPHLKRARVLGVDYIVGRAVSTGGVLWVVGRDPDLLNFFLPERWRRTPKRSLSPRNNVFHTKTKDNVNLVWRVSRMGERVTGDRPLSERAAEWGYNSPFEEFAIALELSRRGLPTTYPRAIYVTGRKLKDFEIFDFSRYKRFSQMHGPFEEPLLAPGYDYITIWGYWNGPDEFLAEHDGLFYTGVNAEEALNQGLITRSQLEEIMARYLAQITKLGFEDLNPKPDHLLLTLDPAQKLVCMPDGLPEIRLCNFELIRPIDLTWWDRLFTESTML